MTSHAPVLSIPCRLAPTGRCVDIPCALESPSFVQDGQARDDSLVCLLTHLQVAVHAAVCDTPAVEFFVKHQNMMTPLSQFAASTWMDGDLTRVALGDALCSHNATLHAVLRYAGGKGGFGKNLAKKGRMYIKAQRRGETNANLQQLARNLRGERIGGQAESEGAVTVDNTSSRARADDYALQKQRAADKLEHDRQQAAREAFASVIKSAVQEGFQRVVAATTLPVAGTELTTRRTETHSSV